MKLSKKILAAFSVAAMLVTAASFVGCKDEDDEEDAFSGGNVDYSNEYVLVKSSDDISTATKTSDITLDKVTDIKKADNAETTKTGYKNLKNDNYFYRAFNKTKTKHRGGIVEIKLTPNATDANEGVCGFVFDLTDGTDKGTYNFNVASVAWRKGTSDSGFALRTYISRFENAAVSNNNYTPATNFTKADGTVISTSNGETEIESAWHELSGFEIAGDGTVTVVIKVGATSVQTDGAYTVGYYTDAATAKSDGENNFENAKWEKIVQTANTSRTDATTQTKLAYYANIYAGYKLTANFDFSKTFGEAVVFEGNPNVISE